MVLINAGYTHENHEILVQRCCFVCVCVCVRARARAYWFAVYFTALFSAFYAFFRKVGWFVHCRKLKTAGMATQLPSHTRHFLTEHQENIHDSCYLFWDSNSLPSE
jgi:hypothetical protein